MANKIFLRLGAWYRAAQKHLQSDLEITSIVEDADAEYPVVDGGEGGEGGGAETLQQVLDNGAVLDKNVDITNPANYTAIMSGDWNTQASQVQVGSDVVSLFAQLDPDNNVDLWVSSTNATIRKTVAGVTGVRKEIATDLQSAIDNGAVLDKDNTIGGAGVFKILTGDVENEDGIQSQLGVNVNSVSLYAQSDLNNSTLLRVTPTGAGISKLIDNEGGELKEIATDLQSALDNGAVLDKNNTINAGAHSIDFLGSNYFSETVSGVEGVSSGKYIEDELVQLYSNNNDVNATLEITPTSVTIQKTVDSVLGAKKEIATVKYLVYTALLTQTGTDAPVATVLENTIGAILWSRGAAGSYVGTLVDAFITGKTVCFIGQDSYTDNGIKYFGTNQWDGANSLYIMTTGADLTTYADAALNNTPIEIRVYYP